MVEKIEKGYDDSPPRNGVILFYTVLTVVALFGVQQLLNSYFAKMMDNEYVEKVYTVGLDEALEFRDKEREQLEKSDIRKAMHLWAQRGHGASPVLMSESGAGKPAITGWSQLKREEAAAPAAGKAVPVQGATLPPNAAGAEQAPSSSGNTSPSPGGVQSSTPIQQPGEPRPVHDAPENSRSPSNAEAAGRNTPAQRMDANSKKPSADGNQPANAQPQQQQ